MGFLIFNLTRDFFRERVFFFDLRGFRLRL